MANPPEHADALWELAKLKKENAKAPDQSSESIFDKPWIKEPEGLTPIQSWLHWMNENALRVEMGIPLLAHPKHTYSKIGGLTDSDSEYSSNSENELDILIQYSKQVKSNSAKNSKSNQDSLPNLVIYATPQGRTVHLRKTQDPNTSGSQPTDLPFQQSAPLDPSSSKQDQEIQDLCREILMVRISEVSELEGDSTERINLDDYNSDDFDEYLFDNMETTTSTITEAQATIKQDPPAPPPAVTVTVQLEEQHTAEDLYVRRRLLN
jgi:hypothetical protein